LSFDEAGVVRAAEKKANPDKDIPEDAVRAAMHNPLLVVYLLRGVEKKDKDAEETSYKRGLVLPALALHFPGINDPSAPKRYVKYRLNRVAQAELDLGDDDLSDDDNED
jgi:hypothetical protein